jgi:hypothetical protein
VGQLYELTGPRSLTMAQVAAEISEASGREIRYAPVSLEQHAAEAAEHGVPPEFVELLTYLFAEVVDGRKRRHNRRCPTGARQRAAGLRRLRAERRGDGRLGLGHRGRLSPASPANALVKTASS